MEGRYHQEVVIADLSLARLIQSGHRTMTPLWSLIFIQTDRQTNYQNSIINIDVGEVPP